jgi:hypothetical protein
MNLRWVMKGEIDAGTFCSLQGTCARFSDLHKVLFSTVGGIKQAGNVATAIWYVCSLGCRVVMTM